MKKHILVLEDNMSLLHLYSRTFTTAGYEVKTAQSVEEARSLLEKYQFDIFLSDVRIGSAFSTDLLREWVDALREKGTRVVVMSAYENYRKFSQEIGVETFIDKPVTPRNLLAMLENSVDENSPTNED